MITYGEVTTVSGVTCSHHVLSIEHLLRELGNCDSPVLLAAASSKRSKASNEKVETRERNCELLGACKDGKILRRHTHVNGQLPQIRVELTREPQASCDTRHNNGDELIQIAVGGG
jgi:hypothetical protein